MPLMFPLKKKAVQAGAAGGGRHHAAHEAGQS